MSHKAKLLINIKRSIFIVLSIICWACMFIYIDSDIYCVICLSLSFMFLILFIVSFVKKSSKKEKIVSEALNKSIFDNAISLEQIKIIYKYHNLDILTQPILKIFFNKDYSKRCLIIQESNAVKIDFQKLDFFDDGTKLWSLSFAQWLSDFSNYNLYANKEIAIKEKRKELEEYHDETIEIEQKQQFFADISWKGITLNSNLIPFGSHNQFKIKIKNQIIDAVIHNRNWYELSLSQANIKIDKNFEIDLNKKFSFEIYYNDKLIAKGKHYIN